MGSYHKPVVLYVKKSIHRNIQSNFILLEFYMELLKMKFLWSFYC